MSGTGTMMLLPPKAHLCQICAADHKPEDPHNAQSLYYQVAHEMQHGRSATWLDAMAHCDADTQSWWRRSLIGSGVDIDAGKINPTRTEGARP